MSGVLFSLPNARQLSLSGAILPGWKAQFYLTETTTPTPVYSDGTLETELPNPVVADGAGYMPAIYMDPEVVYRVQILNSADVLQPDGDIDPYVPSQGGGGGASEPVEITFASTTEIDCSASDTFYGLLSNLVVSTLTLSNPTNGQRLKIMILVSGETGMTYPANWVWANDTPAAEQLTSDRLHEFDMTYLEGPGGAWPPGDFWYVKYTVFYGWPV